MRKGKPNICNKQIVELVSLAVWNELLPKELTSDTDR